MWVPEDVRPGLTATESTHCRDGDRCLVAATCGVVGGAGAVAELSSRQVSAPVVVSANAPLPPGCSRGGSLSEPFRLHPRARYTAAAPAGRRRPRLATAERVEALLRATDFARVPARCYA